MACSAVRSHIGRMTTDRRSILTLGTIAGGLAAFGLWPREPELRAAEGNFPVKLSDAEWKKRLDFAAYRVLRREGTETPYTSPLNKEYRAGTFACKGCSQPLFSSKAKFESGTGWPSFWAPLNGAVATSTDSTLGMTRVEVHCARCGGHLGHVFDDGPRPTGKRYCMNGVAMVFRAA